MKIYKSIEDFHHIENAVVTIGTFDGVHLGHQKILDRLKELAVKSDGESVVLTFFPHPRMVLHPDDHGLLLLNTLEERTERICKNGIQHLIIHPFSKEFSRTSSTGFVRDYLVKAIGTKTLVIGYDHHFGRNREGSLKELQELAPVYGFLVDEIAEQDIDEIAVSSTKIRTALLEGDLRKANQFLGYRYSITGIVKQGAQRGKALGFPTANLEVKENYKLIPANGIYMALISRTNNPGKSYEALLSIGVNPTFGKNPLSIEAYILDFDKDIYGEKIKIEVLSRLREELKFESKEKLVLQMQADENEARQWFRKEKF
ncbi:MAG: bifunctional riboflavin kinase/FAD synthetase [Bacteroidia bacterium]|nr:bifunctional riboflavin kinase/FAD synthetase [Bacteroidia bacterium]MCZ2278514.1 bifunctional riboflavin kinase/FAD synthetase [Bacteroidia bacterium]